MYLEARFTLKQRNLGLLSFTSLGRKNQFFFFFFKRESLRETKRETELEFFSSIMFYSVLDTLGLLSRWSNSLTAKKKYKDKTKVYLQSPNQIINGKLFKTVLLIKPKTKTKVYLQSPNQIINGKLFKFTI